MIKKLKALPILIASGLLVACGSASDSSSGNIPVSTDNTSPTITSIKPDLISNQQVMTDTKSITFTFNEPLSPNSVSPSALNALSFVTSNGKELKGAWTYLEKTDPVVAYELTVEFDFTSLDASALSLPTDESFILHFNNTIKDLAGNGINYTVTFNTPLTYGVEVITTNLPPEKTIEVRIEGQNSINQIIGENGVLVIDTRFEADTSFVLSVTQQPDADTFCAFATSTGKILSRDGAVQLNCGNVVPYVNTANTANWNSYYSQNKPIPSQFVHSGEQRKFPMSNLDNCNNLTIKDDLDAFNWSCEIDNTDTTALKTIIYSTSLKTGTNLSDLLNFSRTSPGWKTNSVSVKQNGSAELNQNKTPAIWWNNPVIIPNSAILSRFETIYIIPDNEPDVSHSYSIKERHIALVVKPGITLKTTINASYAIQIASTGTWLEGNIDANNSQFGVYVNGGYYTQIRNFEISNASDDGIQINNSELTYLFDVTSTGNGGNGLQLLGNTNLDVNIFGNIGHNVTTTSNKKNGLLINSN
ncbi:MAG: right-handed parallel beta-helix repeat-containing protein, partial [Gammaproteobacteria bacterium]|nr:right-handed parallel beta-helix repeat-containing protein [Gammaproteobacteria bacterium]